MPKAAIKYRFRPWFGPAIMAGVGVILLFGLPQLLPLFTLLQLTVYVILSIFALSLGLVWGYSGILCFGQAAFFGLGAYTYAITVINIGESSVPFLLAIALPALLAAALGYFMFYGKVTNIYVGVITLTVGVMLYHVVSSTADPKYRIGKALLGGFNGIPNVPGLNLPFAPEHSLDPVEMYYLSMGLLLAVYVGLNLLLVTRFGRVIVGIRDNEQRIELIGYDARLHKLLVFMLGGALAGLGGALFASWGSFVSPTLFGIFQSAQAIIWVIVGGSGTLLGPIVGCVLISWITAAIGTQQLTNSNLLMGVVMLTVVLVAPNGLLPTMTGRVQFLLARLRRSKRYVDKPFRQRS